MNREAPAVVDSPSGGPVILMVAGEASGDLHGAGLADALLRRSPAAKLLGIGGDHMSEAGVELLVHYRKLAVVGITEVLAHLGDVRRAMSTVLDATLERRPDVVVLIDYPDFNMSLARRLRRVLPGVPIVYFISPQVWAWRSGRVRQLGRLVDLMLVILPFEERLYRDAGVPVQFVGHPLLDSVPAAVDRAGFAGRHDLDPRAEWVGLVPGSRAAEVDRLLPAMLGAADLLGAEGRCFLVPVARALDRSRYEAVLRGAPAAIAPHVHLIERDYYQVLRHSRAAVVCSGTATLETALLGTPMVVVYRTSWLTYNLGKLLVRIRDIALVNVVAGRRGVPELLQSQVTPEAIVRELAPLLVSGAARENTRRFLNEVRERLGEPGACERAAEAVLRVLDGPSRVSAVPARAE